MACGTVNLVFTLANGQYTATTPGGTLLVISCTPPGGIAGWILTSTFGGTARVYSPDPASTCSPFVLIFKNVLIDCGVIDITLKSDLTACLSSSSAAAIPSSSVSPSLSSVSTSPSASSSVSAASAASGGPTVTTPCCPSDPTPQTLYVTFSGATGTCGCLNGIVVTIVYNSGTGRWSGTFSACGGPTQAVNVSCTAGVWIIEFPNGPMGSCLLVGGSATTVVCRPFQLTFSTLSVSVCCSGNINVTVTV